MTPLLQLALAARDAWTCCDRARQVEALDALIEAARRLRDEITRPEVAQGDVPPPVPEKKAGYISKSIHG